jgi:hypothetical protein
MSEITEEAIEEVLRTVWSREQAHGREPAYMRTPLDELVSMESGDAADEHAIRLEAFRRLLEFFFSDGPHPGYVIRRVFAVTKALRPSLILNMSLEEIGLMLGETKAAGSWRIKQLVNRPIAAASGHGSQLPWQKSASACEKYAARAAGNSNRSQKKKKTPKKITPKPTQ